MFSKRGGDWFGLGGLRCVGVFEKGIRRVMRRGGTLAPSIVLCRSNVL